MSKRARVPVIAALAALFGLSPMSGQELATGVWTGTVSPPGDPSIEVQYEVSYDEEGALQITLLPPAGIEAPPSIAFRDEALDEESLRFSWTAGSTDLDCELLLVEDGSFEGECVDDDGVPGHLTMIPPA